MPNNKTKIYTVSQINSLIKGVLEDILPPRLTINGEITDLRPRRNGHCYFTLKDEFSKLPCVMWKSKADKLKFEPENGLAVLATGYIEVYVPHGRYQFIAEKIEPAGDGALQLAFEQTLRRLKAEGLFDDKHKKPLPPYPQRIAILTSPSGAAVGDIKNSIHSRWPCVKLLLYPVPVQGEEAAGKIATALKDINNRNKKLKVDILIVGRGGGSREDLWAFNEEVLARAIYDSKIPVISAVGHEFDVTIADLVADARASTPTKAGVIAVPDMQEIMGRLASMKSRLIANAKARLKLAGQNLETILARSVFTKPLLPILNRQQQVDEIQTEIEGSIKDLLAKAHTKLHKSYEQIIKIEPHRLLGKKTVDLNNLHNLANAAAKAVINNCHLRLTAQTNRLAGLNPKSVLQRGYSITLNKKTGLLVRTLEDVQIADPLITELAGENFIESKVTNKQNRAE